MSYTQVESFRPHYSAAHMNWMHSNRIIAAGVFTFAFILYVMTVAPTASFWDAGEFIAIAHGLQVSHPPGAPFYMLVGRLFSMLASQPMVPLAVNMMSVISSAVTIMLTYLIIVRLLQHFLDKNDSLVTYLGAVIGACTFAVTDSFWFNAVEAEVYAMSMLFTALVVWLILLWSELAEKELAVSGDKWGLQANRLLILVAYLFGLAIGVHLLSLLALFFIALIFFFVQYDRDGWTVEGKPEWRSTRRWGGIILALFIATVVFGTIYPGIVQQLPDWAGQTGAPLAALFGVAIVSVLLVWITQIKRWQVLNLGAIVLLMVLIGYSTYAVIFIRSASDPPIDENDPETPEAIVSYLKREQYGDTPLLRGANFNDQIGQFDDRNIKYFPRRHSTMPNHWRDYAQYNSDLEYFLKYQIRHMYVRYFLWNFSGRESDVEDSRAITGISFLEGPYETYQSTPSERASRNRYFALPLLLGLFGMMYHFSKDWRRAFSVLVLFFITGVGIILYLNQTPMQPRERDYAYVASFFAFCLWVGIGATGLVQLMRDLLSSYVSAARSVVTGALAILVFLAVPGWMTLENYDDHDRSGRYTAPEYAHNMLMSLAPDAIIFTNGDNDTFPLWYAQEVEGVRRDVRVVNLSLLNTPWYVRQLKNQHSRESAPLPISMPEEQIRTLGPRLWEPREITLPVDKSQLVQEWEVFAGQTNIAQFDSNLTWTLRGRPYSTDPNTNQPINLVYGADLAALDILFTNAVQGWQRPVYFAVTVSPDGRLDLENYLQLEGQASRVVPLRHEQVLGRVDPAVALERVKQFKFTNLNNPNVYYDANIRRMVDNYRSVFGHIALSAIEDGYEAEGTALLDTIMAKIPLDVIPAAVSSYMSLARGYRAAGRLDTSVEILQTAEPGVIHNLTSSSSSRSARYYEQFIEAIRTMYLEARAYEAAAGFENALSEALGSDNRISAEELRIRFEGLSAAPADSDSAEALPESP